MVFPSLIFHYFLSFLLFVASESPFDSLSSYHIIKSGFQDSKMVAHPLDPLTLEEIDVVRCVILDHNDGKLIDFREAFLHEPPKELMKQYLDLEHAGKLDSDTPRPPRLAKAQYDVVGLNKKFEFHESCVDVDKKERVSHEVVDDGHHASLTV